MAIPFQNGDRLLFQGASTVESGRFDDPNGLGYGFPAIIAGFMRALLPDVAVEITNRGESGNATTDLLARWKEDCIDLAPTHLSIHVGLNDCLRKYEAPFTGYVPVPDFKVNYRRLLDLARGAGARYLFLMAPTALDKDPRHVENIAVIEYDAAVREIAAEYSAVYVPARDALWRAIASGPSADYWIPDGRHPSTAGHAAISFAWLRAAGLL